jgi:predicted dehydrogenase
MGQEHISYILGYSSQIQIDYLCDPVEESLERAKKVMAEFSGDPLVENSEPIVLSDEQDLLSHVDSIDLLVIASPNFLHTPSLLKWGQYDLTILVEKPLCVSREQHDELRALASSDNWKARVWVAMEYRYIPAIAKLLSLLPQIGDLKMVTIRENRYPFLHKVGKWNRDRGKTGDTLVEKCCHFFDLFR